MMDIVIDEYLKLPTSQLIVLLMTSDTLSIYPSHHTPRLDFPCMADCSPTRQLWLLRSQLHFRTNICGSTFRNLTR